jgi:hypothetical protein
MEKIMGMKLFHFHYYDPQVFTSAVRRGTWFPKGAKLCPTCHTSTQERIDPLVIEWETRSREIGDFVWPALDSELVVTQRVKDIFDVNFPELEYSLVEFWQNPRTKVPPKHAGRSTGVGIPHEDPLLWAVRPIKWCHVDHEKSNIKIKFTCSTCKKVFFDVPNLSENHLVLDTNTRGLENIFHIYEYSGAIFCTDRVKDLVEKNNFTNVRFVEDGEIPSVEI